MRSFLSMPFFFLLFVNVFLSAAYAQSTADYEQCKEGSDIIDAPECPADDEDHPVYFPFPYDCTQYFECSNGHASCIQCAPGTVWDQENLICNHPAAVNCTIVTTPIPTSTTQGPTELPTDAPTDTPTDAPTDYPTEVPTDTPTDAPTEVPTDTPTDAPTDTPTDTPTDYPTEVPTDAPTDAPTEVPTDAPTDAPTDPPTYAPTTEDDPANWVCPEGFQGFIRHPYDCTLFYQCDSGRRPCLFECVSGLYFNPATERCEFPVDVPDCAGGSPPPTSTTPRYKDNGMSLNYRNVNRDNFVESVKYVSRLVKERLVGDLYQDPCQMIKAYLSVN